MSALLHLLAAILLPFTVFLPVMSAPERPFAVHSLTVLPLPPATPSGPPRLRIIMYADPGAMPCVGFYRPPATFAGVSVCPRTYLGEDRPSGPYDGQYDETYDAPGFAPDWFPGSVSLAKAPNPGHQWDQDVWYYFPGYDFPDYFPDPTVGPGHQVVAPLLEEPVGAGHTYTDFPFPSPGD